MDRIFKMKTIYLILVLSVAPMLLPAQVINFTNYSPTGATLNWNTAANWNATPNPKCDFI